MIQYVDIDHFKCFTLHRINLSHITVLAGANSAGKSSVIQSLLLSRVAFERLQAVNFDPSIPVSIPLNGEYLLSLGNSQEVFNRDEGENFLHFRFVGIANESIQFVLRGDYIEDSVYDLLIDPLLPPLRVR